MCRSDPVRLQSAFPLAAFLSKIPFRAGRRALHCKELRAAGGIRVALIPDDMLANKRNFLSTRQENKKKRMQGESGKNRVVLSNV